MKLDLEEIQARINANLPQPSEGERYATKPDSESLQPDHPLRELWIRMSEMYGHQWASQQGDEPNDTWVRGLREVATAQLGVGLRALLERADTWPPNLVEFRQLCLEHDPDSWERQAHKAVDQSAMLENKTAKERRAADGLANIKKLREEVGL